MVIKVAFEDKFIFSERKFDRARRFIHRISRRAIANLQPENRNLGQMWTFVIISMQVLDNYNLKS